MSSDVAIRVQDVAKHYLMFQRPEDRLKQSIVPRLQRLLGRPPKQYYRDFAALRGVSFEVKRGETVGIVGRNGCGKSTLLQIVCGTLQPTSGTVEVNGRIAALLELGAGFNPDFTGRENVYMNAAILGLSRAETDARFDAIARFADIGIFIDQPVKTYSSGMFVRLAFAVAINVDPDILVVDEALAVGDEAFQRKCFARIEDIKDKGGTILFVSHGAQTIVQLCDRAMLIDCGELILEGRPKLVVGQYQRLVNASPQGASGIRASIIALRDSPPEPVSSLEAQEEIPGALESRPVAEPAPSNVATAVAEHPPAAATPEPAPAASVKDDVLADYFDPNLKSQSTVYLEERGARIRDVRITTLDGKPVNVLRMGKRYILEYSVDFFEDVRNVGFAFGVRTASGVLLAGTATFLSHAERISQVRAGERKNVKFEFFCPLTPATYFWLCGTRGFIGHEQILLHRVIDAFCARVVGDLDSTVTGFFDLNVVTSID